MGFDKAQLAQFKEEGYLIVPGFFSETEVSLMQGALQKLVDDGLLLNIATSGDGQTHSEDTFNLQICPLSPQSETFRALPFSNKVRTAVEDLIGPDFLLQLDQIFLKPGKHGAGTNWHQDNAYFGIDDPQQGVGMWVAVHDACVANGTMRIVPRSHERVYTHERDMGSDHHISCVVDESTEEVIPVEMKAGGALFFNYGIVHCTKGNTTDHERAGLALHFLKEKYRQGLGGENKHPTLSGPAYDAGKAAWGESLEGLWESMVSTL